ncbi:MAG: hypothetical protein ABR568_23085, partial [Pyrinomonadaceae bacterium]
TCPPAQAEFKGTFRSDTPVTVEVTSSANNAGGAAVAVYYLGRGLDVEAVFSVPAGTAFAQECSKPGSRVKRIIVEVDLPQGGQGLVRVGRGAGDQFEINIINTGDGQTYRFVFDVV